MSYFYDYDVRDDIEDGDPKKRQNPGLALTKNGMLSHDCLQAVQRFDKAEKQSLRANLGDSRNAG